MRKIFVLDTSVLVYDPKSYLSFAKNDVIIPITVLDELDKIKKFANESGKNARVAIRNLDNISNLGEIHTGIQIENDTVIKIDVSAYDAVSLDPTYGDGKILACAIKIKEHTGSEVILVSRDINLRIRAKAFGLVAQDYEKDNITSNDLYNGIRTVDNDGAGKKLLSTGIINIYKELNDMYPNEYVNFIGKHSKGISLGKRVGDQIKLVKSNSPWGLQLKNKEQFCAVDLMMDMNIPLVSLTGKSGGGKTLVAIASALEMVLSKKIYDNFMIFRPTYTIGEGLGFLPGTLEAKIEPLFGAIGDAFSFLFPSKTKKNDGWNSQLFQYIDNGTIQKNPISYLRGRSIHNAFILIDEAQNISKDEIKAILTRCGEGTKIVLTGDPDQIDAPVLDATNNGLSYVVEKFKSSELAGSICFIKGERSALATLASEIL
jgi:PhoH-like ATPase